MQAGQQDCVVNPIYVFKMKMVVRGSAHGGRRRGFPPVYRESRPPGGKKGRVRRRPRQRAREISSGFRVATDSLSDISVDAEIFYMETVSPYVIRLRPNAGRKQVNGQGEPLQA